MIIALLILILLAILFPRFVRWIFLCIAAVFMFFLAQAVGHAAEVDFRSMLNYDIAEECVAIERSMPEESANPGKDIPQCIRIDTEALTYLNEHWYDIPRAKADSCLAAFGRGDITPGGNAWRYTFIAQCVGAQFSP